MRHPFTNDFIERFNRTALDECSHISFRTTFYESVEALQVDCDAWLGQYSTERPTRAIATWGGARSRLSNSIFRLSRKKVKNTCHRSAVLETPGVTVAASTPSDLQPRPPLRAQTTLPAQAGALGTARRNLAVNADEVDIDLLPTLSGR